MEQMRRGNKCPYLCKGYCLICTDLHKENTPLVLKTYFIHFHCETFRKGFMIQYTNNQQILLRHLESELGACNNVIASIDSYISVTGSILKLNNIKSMMWFSSGLTFGAFHLSAILHIHIGRIAGIAEMPLSLIILCKYINIHTTKDLFTILHPTGG